jgi:hypothetical protein
VINRIFEHDIRVQVIDAVKTALLVSRAVLVDYRLTAIHEPNDYLKLRNFDILFHPTLLSIPAVVAATAGQPLLLDSPQYE